MRRRHIAAATAVTALGFAAAHHSQPTVPVKHAATAKHRKHLSQASDALTVRVSPRPVSRSQPTRAPLPEVTHPAATQAPQPPVPTHDGDAFLAWLHSSMSHQVRECESNFDYGMFENNGGTDYFGAWSANADFVRTYAHVDPYDFLVDGRFTLSKAAQDRMAYRGWQSRGWSPWTCAS